MSRALADPIASDPVLQLLDWSHFRDANLIQIGWKMLYVPDAEAAHARARARGAEEVQPVAPQFYGDRAGGVRDSNGTFWWFATRERMLDEDALAAAARAEEARRRG